MSQITYTDKSQVEDYNPDLFNAQDCNQIKEAVNSKADLSALQSEIDNRVEQQTDIVNDIYDLQQADIDLQMQIDNISGGGEIDLTNYYNKAQSDSRFVSTATTIFNGDYNSLSNKPSIPSISGLASESWVNGRGFLTGVTWNLITGKPSFFDGNYENLTNKPSIPSVAGLATISYVDDTIEDLQGQIDNLAGGGEVDLTNYYTKSAADSRFLSTGTSLFSGAYGDLSGKPNLSIYLSAVTWSDITSKPSFSTVATTGSYDDLSNLPDLSLKVDKDGLKGLSDVNYSVVDYTKLSNIEANATKNQADSYLLNLANATGNLPASQVTEDSTHRFWTDAKESTFSGLIGGLLADVETKLPISGSTSFISNSTDSFGDKITNIVSLSVAQYEALSTKDPYTLYFQYD